MQHIVVAQILPQDRLLKLRQYFETILHPSLKLGTFSLISFCMGLIRVAKTIKGKLISGNSRAMYSSADEKSCTQHDLVLISVQKNVLSLTVYMYKCWLYLWVFWK